MIWAIKLQRLAKRGQYMITLPKQWVKNNTDPEDKLLFLEEIEKGIAHAYVGRRYYDKRIAKPADAPNSGTGEPGQDGNGQGCVGGAGEQPGIEGSAPADISQEGKR